MKRLIFILFIISLSCLVSVARDFSYTYEGQTLVYTVLDEDAKTCETKAGDLYKGPGNRVSGTLILPEKVMDGNVTYTLTRIGDIAFNGCTGLTGPLTIPNSVTSIGEKAFYYCTGLTGPLTIPTSVTSIGSGAFGDCSGFTGPLTIPTSVTSIGSEAFLNCSGFTGPLTIPNSITLIDYATFQNCSGLTGSLTIPNSVTKIGLSAFDECSGLTGPLTIPNSVTTIGIFAFYGCSGFTGPLTIPNSVTSIGRSAFSHCSGLTGSLTIPNSVTSIGDNAFRECSGLTGPLTIPNSVTSIESQTFYNCSGLTGPLTFSNSVISIGRSAFENCSGLTGPLTIPNSVTSIGEWAFYGCSSLNGPLTISNSVTSIGERAFYGCSGLTGPLTISDSLTSIGEWAFYGCSGLTGPLTIPNSVTSIGKRAFYGCSGLNGPLTIPNSVTLLDNGVFCDCSSLTGPLTIPNSVTKINGDAFENCCGLTGPLTIPNSVTEIGGGAFQNCSGFNGPLTISNSVNLIGMGAFENCTGLTGPLTIPNSVTTIGNSAFSNCSGLTGPLTIPNSVTNIYGYTFYNCIGLTELYLPENLLGIDGCAFVSSSRNMKIERVYCKALTPPNILAQVFDYNTTKSATLIVPTESIELYKTAIEWNQFFNIKGDKEVEAISIELNKTIVSVKATETVQLTATILPETTSDKSVAWTSSDSEIATVNTEGLVTAISEGTAIITATSANGLSAKCLVEVIETPATDIVIDKEALGISGDDLEMKVGDEKTIKVTVLPETTTDKKVAFESSDPSVASVNSDGKITALAIGKTTITVTAKSGVSTSINVTVVSTQAESVTLDRKKISLQVSGTVLLVATVMPENASDKSVTWESSDTSIATVDETGLVTAVGIGNAIITAYTKNGLSDECEVTVIETPSESVTLNRKDVTLQISEKVQLEATVMPENTTDKSVSWESSDTSVAAVDETGLVTAVGIGNAIITASTTNGHSDECMITVVGIPVTEIIIDKESLGIVGDDLEMNVGETRTINVTVVPDNATDKGIYFKSSDKSIASVNSYGKLTALSPGKSVITVIAYSGVSTSFNVIVKMQPVSSVSTKVSPLKIREGGVISVSAEQPTGGYESGWKWYWSLNGADKSSDLEFDYIPTMPWGIERSTESIQFVFRAHNYTLNGYLYTYLSETTETVTVYRPPLMPKQLLKKGDGTSHTLIAMAEIDNERLTELGYTFVYGYTDVAGQDHIVASTPLRYCRAEESVYDNPENSFWVYCAWTYDDGSVVTSGKRYMNGLADENFDASSFDNNVKIAVKRNNPEGWITPTPDGVSLNIVSDADSDIMIYDVMGRLVKSLKAEGGTAFCDKIVLDGNISKVYIVKITSGMESIERKIIVR